MLLTIPATAASAERFFSKLKLVKNYLRSATSQTRLVDLARLTLSLALTDQFIVSLEILRIKIPENRSYNS